uniref:Protein kinase domain-containing protein n=1 Tax=Eiseniibacteriota bacterium TaxID=2212470 RepID=A0A832HZN4_UNCEI
MTEPRDPFLERLAESLADGETPDWGAVRVSSPAEAARVEALRILDRLAASHREARIGLTRSRLAELDRASVTERVSALEFVPPMFTWGFLRVLDRIGEGSFGEVYRAYDPTLHREVALKLRRLPAEQAGVPNVAATMDVRARHWLEEARRLASVRHPHVLTVFGAAVHDGRAGLWTELVRGETLEQRLARTGPLAPREIAAIGADLCAALAAVHAAGLVHGDVKPSNVMLEPGGAADPRERVVLMDFGAAHEISQRERAAAMTAGTPLVMAPELLEGVEASVSSDVYAAGAVLHRLATGAWPVEAASLDELRARHRAGARAPRAGARPGLPVALARAIDRALAPRPADRFASATEFRAALMRLAAPARGWRQRALAAGSAIALVAALAALWFAQRSPSNDSLAPRSALPPVAGPAPVMPGPVLTGTMPDEFFASCMAAAGDVNGDGYGDVVVGSLGYSGEFLQQGRLTVLRGSASGLATSPSWEFRGVQREEGLGAFVAGAGDVDGDGFDDVLGLSRWVRPGGTALAGRLYLFRGSPAGPEPAPAWVFEGGRDGGWLGNGIAFAGDVNGDGFDDVLVGCTSCGREHELEGNLSLFLGSARGLASEPARVWWGGGPDANLGWRAARIGDVNADGYDDVLLGAPHWSGRLGREGRVQVDYGGPGGPDGIADWTDVGDQRDAALGWSLGGGGDLNGDGIADFVAAQTSWSGRFIGQGRVLVYLGSRRGPVRLAGWHIAGYRAGSAEGTGAVGIARDLDGDGRDEVFTATPSHSTAVDSLRVGVLTVGALDAIGRRGRIVWREVGSLPNTPIGWWAASAGDVNGDGLGDFLLNQPNYRSNADRRGRLFTWYGRRASPRPR